MELLYSPLDDVMLTALRQPNVMTAEAVRIDFPSGISRVHSATGDLVIGGEVYRGVGNLGEIGAVTEEHTTSPGQISLTLGGLDTSLIATTLNEKVIGCPVQVFFVVLDLDSGAPVAANLLYRGKVSATALTAGANSALAYTVSNVFEDWARGQTWRFTDESQRKRAKGLAGVDDRIMRYVAQMAERSIYWGNKKDAPAFVYE